MRISAFLLGLFLLPGLAFAQSVEIKSADHAGFSRLAFTLPIDAEWEFGVSGGAYEFRTTTGDFSFDASGVFRRMTRDRIRELDTSQSGVLRLDTTQGLHADVFELRDGLIAIDIKDGPPPSNSPFETPLVATVNAPEQEDIATGPATRPPEPVQLPPPAPVAPQITLTLPSLSDFGRDTTSAPSVQTEDAAPIYETNARPTDRPELADQRVLELEKTLIEQIGRAAAEGLLEPSLPRVDEAMELTNVPSEEPEVARSANDHLPEPDPADLSHVSIETAVQRAANEHRGATNAFAQDGSRCIPSRRLSVETWGPPLGDGLEIATYRTGIVDELDGLDEDGALDMVRYYLFLTFGAEARAVLDMIETPHQDLSLYYTLSNLMEHGQVQDLGILAGQQSCDTTAALWSAIALPRLAKGMDLNETAILTAFSALPEHLRRELGPSLARKFADIDDLQSANQIENVFERRTPLENLDTMLMDASIAKAQEKPHEAAHIIDDIVKNHAPETPETLIAYVDNHVAGDEPIAIEVQEMADVIAVEYRGHPLESDLVEAAILARIQSENPQTAFSQVDTAMGANRISSAQALDLRLRAISKVTSVASDIAFLKMTYGRDIEVVHEAGNEVLKEAVNARLLELGFAGVTSDSHAQPKLTENTAATTANDAIAQQDWPALSSSQDANLQQLATASKTRVGENLSENVPSLQDLSTMLEDLGKTREAIRSLLSQ